MVAPGDDSGPGPHHGARTDRGSELARTLLVEAREELLKADHKAGLLLAFLGAALASLVGALGGGTVTPRHYDPVPQLLLWSGCAACVAALVELGLAVVPRMGSPRSGRAHYFGDTRLAPSVLCLEWAVRRTDHLHRDLSQLAALSEITWAKYRHIRHALVWGTLFVVLTLLGIATGTSL
ncbi:Pycsar system effector family protein [Streptomyces sp. NPDC054784]